MYNFQMQIASEIHCNYFFCLQNLKGEMINLSKKYIQITNNTNLTSTLKN